MITSPYQNIARLLSPRYSQETINFIRNLKNKNDWPSLLTTANQHLCTPLLYICLRREHMLQHLPRDLTEYLASLHALNHQRNSIFISELRKILQLFARNNLKLVPLKGAATFLDNLYGDLGARMLRDLDLLIMEEDIDAAQQLLIEAGYVETKDPGRTLDNTPTDARHHHLHPYHKPGTPSVIELHYKTGYAQINDVMPADDIWKNSLQSAPDNIPLPCPSHRLLHNCAHGLLGHGEFIRGDISLQQLSEFAWLINRYSKVIQWQPWQQTTIGQLTYLLLAKKLFAIELPINIETTWRASMHIHRICSKGDLSATINPQPLRLLLHQLYFWVMLPAWTWKNVCYTETSGNLFSRTSLLFRKIFDKKTWAKIHSK